MKGNKPYRCRAAVSLTGADVATGCVAFYADDAVVSVGVLGEAVCL